MINDLQRSSHLFIHYTNDYRQYCHPGNTAQHCRLGLFQDSDFAGDFENSKSTSGGVLCIFGSRTVVPVSWMCKKQTSVSHSSTEAETISLGAGLRVDVLPALDISENVIEVLRTTKDNIQLVHTSSGKLWQIQPNHTISRTLEYVQQNWTVCEPNMSIENKGLINSAKWIVYSPTHVLLKVNRSCTSFEDNEAVIKMIIKGRSPTMRHVSRTHRVALEWLFDRINL